MMDIEIDNGTSTSMDAIDSMSFNPQSQQQQQVTSKATTPRLCEVVVFPCSVVDSHSDQQKTISNSQLKKQQLLKRRIKRKLKQKGEEVLTRESESQSNGIVMIAEKKYQPIPIFYIPPHTDDFFAFGEIVLEGDFLHDAFNIQKSMTWPFWKCDSVQFEKDSQFLSIEISRRVDTSSNFDCMIQRYINTPNAEVHSLGVVLQEYQRFSISMLKHLDMNRGLIEKQFMGKSLQVLKQEYYERSLEWMKTQIDENTISFYALSEFDFDTHDVHFKRSGYSQQLLELIGLDHNMATSLILRKGRLEFLDGLSRMYRLKMRLMILNKRTINTFKIEIEHNILTMDEITIPTKCEISIPNFHCIKEENLKELNEFSQFLIYNYSCFRLFKFRVNPNIVKHIKSKRQTQFYQTICNDSIGMEYPVMSEIFIEKYYPKGHEIYQPPQEVIQEKEDPKESNQDKNICKYRYI